ncbi:hypothetical protein H5410_003774, partial [Solanum commersonii]
MAPRGHIYKQNTLTVETVSATQSVDEPNKCTFATTTELRNVDEKLEERTKELTIEEKDDAARAEIVSYTKKFLVDEDNPEGIEPDRIEFYKDTHYSSDKGWSSQEVEADYRIMIDLKDLYPSMTSDEIVDLILDTKPGSMKVLGYGPKPNTNQATPKRLTDIQHDLQERLTVSEVVVKNQHSRIETLNSPLDTLSANKDDQVQHIMSTSRSRLEVVQLLLFLV